jgi:hypothetical protein
MQRSERLKVTFRVLPDGVPTTVVGRDAWMYKELLKVGPRGLTTLENPAPRISHYIFKLRKAGLLIQSDDERHGGQFSGSHARYRLVSETEVISDSSKTDAEGIAA